MIETKEIETNHDVNPSNPAKRELSLQSCAEREGIQRDSTLIQIFHLFKRKNVETGSEVQVIDMMK